MCDVICEFEKLKHTGKNIYYCGNDETLWVRRILLLSCSQAVRGSGSAVTAGPVWSREGSCRPGAPRGVGRGQEGGPVFRSSQQPLGALGALLSWSRDVQGSGSTVAAGPVR